MRRAQGHGYGSFVIPSEVEESLIVCYLIRSLPVRSTSGLPVYVAASPAAPFSAVLETTIL